MSKIYNVRRAFYKIFENLKNHEVSLLFFNNDFKIYTTLHESLYSVDHSIMLSTIQNIRCSSITDFSQIILGMKIIQDMNCDLPVISTIISDGYHTIDDDANLSYEEIKQKLEKKFDYAIGLGTDYDKNLLELLGISFLHDQTSNMLNFLNEYFSENKNFIIIEPDQFIVSQNEFKVHDNNVENNDKTAELISDSIYQETFCIKETESSSRDIKKKHFIFVIDNSGSMDDTFHSRVLENFYEDANFYMRRTGDSNEKILFYDRNAKVIIGKKDIINHDNITIYNENDEIFKVCKDLYEMKNDTKLEVLYRLYNQNIVNINLKKFVQRNYNLKLSAAEKKFNVLLHNELDKNQKLSQTSQLLEKNTFHCSICFENTPTILFSCNHLFCCFDCVLKIIEEYKPKCPVCRDEIKWLRKCILKNKNFSCIKCEKNIVDTYQSPCSHLLYCINCYPYRSLSCSECDKDIEETKNVKVL
jgi:hypothetical protein